MKTKLAIRFLSFGYGCLLLFFFSCQKQDAFLAAKPNEALVIPSTLADLQSLLHNEGLFNINDPALGEIASDNFYVTTAVWNGLGTTQERNGYTWASQIYDAGVDIGDWTYPYQQIYTTNTVLEYLPKVAWSSNQQNVFNQVKGIALFYRAIAFYNLVQTFALPYDSSTATTTLGIPLRLSDDLNSKSVRATEQQCYDQIIGDLLTALPLLAITPDYKTQPSQPAAHVLLARVYLAMGNYAKAFQYADAALGQQHTLTDYNTLSPNTRTISTVFLSEDIFHTTLQSYLILTPTRYSITDSALFASYDSNDLRKTAFFVITNGLPYFRGTYDYKKYEYSGIATDEIYLIRAECNARLGNTVAAMADLNTLLVTRWKTNTFVPYTAHTPDNALKQILTERRKELLYRGLRWTDLRRLNKDSRYAVTLTRVVNGMVYTLPPNDPKYAFPIPDNEIKLSGIAQNPR